MRRITGTTIYTYVACPRAAELDLHEERSQRRPLTEAEELSRQRGRELEALRVADLGYAEPLYEKSDYGDGAAQTLAFLRAGVAGVTQGVLADGDLLGIPDLLRKEPGASALGDFHYVVGDVKSSALARADQALQVAFYARLLAKLQGRPPSYGFLWLKSGREYRLPLAELAPVLDDVMARVATLARGKADGERPFLQAACRRCHWSTKCDGELRAREDLSLVGGMTRGLRTTLEAAGVARASELCEATAERLGHRAHLESALVRGLQVSARAWRDGQPQRAHDDAGDDAARLASAACVHVLVDGFAERLLCVGATWHEAGRARTEVFVPQRADDEWDAFARVLAAVPLSVPLLHWGQALPAWFQRASYDHFGDVGVHGRLVDLARRLRGTVAFQAPVFGLRDAVLHGLGRDPDRAGDADAAPLWCRRVDAESCLRTKMIADLDDIAELARRFL